MKKIQLSQEKYTLVDDEFFEWLNQWKWSAWKNPYTKSFYAVRTDYSGNKPLKIYMHRLIMNNPKKLLVDHKNHNTLLNTKKNLRIATASQNQANGQKRPNNKTGFKGVSWYVHAKKFAAGIRKNGKHIHLGLFLSAKEAGDAYDTAAKDLFGEFALLNKKEEL